MLELKASEWYTVTGRGQMAAVDLRQIPGCPERINTVDDIPLQLGQQVHITDHGVYEIWDIEYATALMSPPFIKPGVCLRLKAPAITDGPADGETFDPNQDQDRLNLQRQKVWVILLDGQWHTPAEFEARIGDNWASLGARVRDFRKAKFGGHTIECRRIPGGGGLHEYRLVLP